MILSFNNKNSEGNIWMPPVLVNSQLILVGGKKKLLQIDAFEGRLIKSIKLPGFAASSPFIVNKNLFLMLRNGDILQVE